MDCTDDEDSRHSHLLPGQRSTISPERLLPPEQNEIGPDNETLPGKTEGTNLLIQTLEPYVRPTITATHQLLPQERGRGGGSGRGQSRHTSTNRADETDNENECITPSEPRKKC